MHCNSCKHWQGRGITSIDHDCYRVIGWLQPQLYHCYLTPLSGDETVRYYWRTPFDPHDYKYWMFNAEFIRSYTAATRMDLDKYISRSVIRTEDVKYTRDGGQVISKVPICYFKQSDCSSYHIYRYIAF